MLGVAMLLMMSSFIGLLLFYVGAFVAAFLFYWAISLVALNRMGPVEAMSTGNKVAPLSRPSHASVKELEAVSGRSRARWSP